MNGLSLDESVGAFLPIATGEPVRINECLEIVEPADRSEISLGYTGLSQYHVVLGRKEKERLTTATSKSAVEPF